MSAYLLLSAPVRAFFSLWTLLLCLACIAAGLLSAVRRRYAAAAQALLLFLPAYSLWQAAFDLSLFGAAGGAAGVSLALGGTPWLGWLAVLVQLSLGSALLLNYIVRYDATAITPTTVKLYLDRLPCGICCWQDSGRVLFSNVCMDRLCREITGGPLLNGEQFRASVEKDILTAGESVWRFSCRELVCGGERLRELIASDVTAEYAKTQALERDRAELAEQDRELREYYSGIDDVVRRQELLQARVDIHDEMNRLMLSTTAADSGDTAALDRIFSLWEQNALLLGKAAEGQEDGGDMLRQLAAALGVRLICPAAVPALLTSQQRGLFTSAAQEAVVNAVKHGKAKTVTVSAAETDDALECRFENDGVPPRDEVRFTGGLANLTLLAAEQGASVSARSDGGFALLLRFPKNAGGPPSNG